MRNAHQYLKIIYLTALFALVGLASIASASQIKLEVALGTPVMQAGKTQTAF